MPVSVVIFEESCTGCEYCVKHLPEVFRMKPPGISSAGNPGGVSRERIEEVVGNCPAECIRIVD